ncbi:hypothetical protein [Marinobacter shengliensis]|nr:hypothetical protein [Marinobacter shengliensis]
MTATLADAILDRLVHNAYKVNLRVWGVLIGFGCYAITRTGTVN